MKETRITVPELMLLAGTRAILGVGIGLLLADRLPEGQRKGAGWAALIVGALTTIPLAIEVFAGRVVQSHEQIDEFDDVGELVTSR